MSTLSAWTLYLATMNFQQVDSRLRCVWREKQFSVSIIPILTAIECSTWPYLCVLVICQRVHRWQHTHCLRIGILVTEIATYVSVSEAETINGVKIIVVNEPCLNVWRPQQCAGLAAVCAVSFECVSLRVSWVFSFTRGSSSYPVLRNFA